MLKCKCMCTCDSIYMQVFSYSDRIYKIPVTLKVENSICFAWIGLL